jgi:hypothetical protein
MFLNTKTQQQFNSLSKKNKLFVLAVTILLLCQQAGRMTEAIDALRTIAEKQS